MPDLRAHRRARLESSKEADVRLAYADPPYPGRAARHYRNHADFGGEVDHPALIALLDAEYDGWALSTGAHALREVLAAVPAGPGIRVACWYKTNAEPPLNKAALWHYSWEPVIVRPARARKRVRDVLCAGAPMGVLGGSLVGQKPRAFCDWVFDLLGAEGEDDFTDLFPGSGAVGAAWDSWRMQGRIAEAIA